LGDFFILGLLSLDFDLGVDGDDDVDGEDIHGDVGLVLSLLLAEE